MKQNTSITFAAISLIMIAVLLIIIPTSNDTTPKTKTSLTIKQTPPVLNFDSSKTLLDHFKTENYNWPITRKSSIPHELVRAMPADASTIKDIKTRKSIFIRVMLPIIMTEQKRIRDKRQMLKLALKSDAEHYKNTHAKLNKIFAEYKISNKLNFPEKSKLLLMRLDELPLTFVLAQAAIESGWGTSRFTRVGNSLFGEWTYKKGEGIVPEGREDGKSIAKMWKRNVMAALSASPTKALYRGDKLYEAGVRVFRVYSPEPGTG